MTIIARGDILVGLNDDQARNELRRLEQHVKQSFHDMNRQRAVPKVTLEHDDYDRAYKEVKRKIEDLKNDRAKAIVRLDVDGVTKATADIKLLEAELRQFANRRYETQVKIDVDRDAKRAVDAISETLRKLTSGKFYTNIGVDVDESDLRRVEQEIDGRINALNRKKAKLVIEGDATGVAGVIAEIKTLDAALTEVRRRIRGFEDERARTPIRIGAELNDRDLRLMRANLRREVVDLEKQRVQLRIDGDTEGLERIEQRIQTVLRDMERLGSRRWQLRLGGGDELDRTSTKGQRALGILERLTHTVREGRNWWNEFGGSILGAGIRLGPLTLRLRAAVAVMTYLAPLLLSLVGAFGALASVLYTGLLGTLGPAVAGIGALGIGMAGIVGVAIPLVKNLGAVSKAQKAYNDAVSKHGRASDQAAKKMEELRNVMGGVGKTTATAFMDIRKLGQEWTRLTKPARASFFDTIAEGVKTARAQLPFFARESVRTFDLAATGVQRWLRGLRGPEARGIFRSLFRGAQESIPNLLNSLGNVGTFLGRIAKAAMPLWNEFTRTIERWTGGWADAAKDTGGVREFLRGLADDTASLGRFIGAAARALHNLFMGGRGAGQSFLQTITNTLNRWADFLATVEGQNAVDSFFRRSIDMAQTFLSIVGNLGHIFFGIAEGLAPVANAVAKITEAVTSFPGWSTFFTVGIGAVLLLRTLSKVASTLIAVKAAATALRAGGGIAGALAAGNIARQQQLGRLPTVGTTVATEAAGSALGASAGTRLVASHDAAASSGKRLIAVERGVAKEVGASAAGAGAASLRFAALRTALAGTTGTVGLAATAFTLYAVGLNKAFDSISKTKDAANSLRAAYDVTGKAAKVSAAAQGALTASGLQHQQSLLGLEAAERRVNQLRRQGKQGTAEYRQAIIDYEAAVTQSRAAEEQLVKAQKTANVSAHARVGAIREQIRATEALPQNAERVERLERLWRQLARAENAEIASAVNVGRAQRGLAAITGNTAQTMGQLIRQFARLPKGDTVRKFFVQADTRQAEAGIRNIQKLQAAGISDRQIIRVFASTDNAETALAKIRALAENVDKLSPNVTVGAKDNASNRINRVRSIAQAIVRPFVATLVGRDNASGVARRVVTAASRVARTFLASLQARDAASGVIGGALSLLNAFDGRNATSTITTIHRTVRAPGEPGRLVRGPRGAVGGERPTVPRRTAGEIVRKSTFLTGEEHGSPEIVIATNPTYRRRNLSLLKHAARALGVPHVGDEIRDVLGEGWTMPDSFESFIPAFAAGGSNAPTKKDRARFKQRKRVQGRRTKKAKRQIRRLSRRWQPEVRDAQERVRKIETDIEDKVEHRNQDDQQFGIDLDNNPIVTQDSEGNDVINEGARTERINKLGSLQRQTQAIINRYNDLKNALNAAIEKINNVIDRFHRRRDSISTKKYGSKGARDLRKDIDDKINNLAGDRKSAEERLHDIGDERERGEQRGERLQWNQYDAEVRQTRAITARTQDAAAGGGTTDANAEAIAEQANERASAFRRLAEISEGALRVFGGAGDIAFGGSRAFEAAVSGGSGLGRTASGGAVAAQAQAESAFGRRSDLSATPAPVGAGAAGGGPQIIIQTLHPGDPATLDAIGRAATGGLSLQGYVPSPREAVGL